MPQRKPESLAVLPEKMPNPVQISAVGQVSFFGRHEAGLAWIFSGVAIDDVANLDFWNVTAVFDRGSIHGQAEIVASSLGKMGPGLSKFVMMLQCSDGRKGSLQRLEISMPDGLVIITGSSDLELSSDDLRSQTEDTLALITSSPRHSRIVELLRRTFIGEAYLEIYGYHTTSCGWLLNGWLSLNWISASSSEVDVILRCPDGDIAGNVIVSFYYRDDLKDRGSGFVMHLPAVTDTLTRPISLIIKSGDAVVTARLSQGAERLQETSLIELFSSLIGRCESGLSKETLLSLVSTRAIAVVADETIMAEIDTAYDCWPDSLIIVGWLLSQPGQVSGINVRSGPTVWAIDLDLHFLPLERSDVLENIGKPLGYVELNCGFLLRAPLLGHGSSSLTLEIITSRGTTLTKEIPSPRPPSLDTIKSILSIFVPKIGDINGLFDHIVGPAIKSMNSRVIDVRAKIDELIVGPQPPNPSHSVVISLYGRIDFLRYQIATFAQHGLPPTVELIYVLDDPLKERETKLLAVLLFNQFKIPLRLLCLSRNSGFASANNVGLRAATGQYVCFLNSDVFPTTGDWLTRLSAHLQTSSGVGAIAPLLLFEDGTTQHAGIKFEPSLLAGSWFFATHVGKGTKPPNRGDLVTFPAITAACLMMRHNHAVSLGGFDENYIIGDFEDTDLCLRIRTNGQKILVDFSVILTHLERKSQDGSSRLWRRNLTLYNAWLHQRQWGDTIQQSFQE